MMEKGLGGGDLDAGKTAAAIQAVVEEMCGEEKYKKYFAAAAPAASNAAV